MKMGSKRLISAVITGMAAVAALTCGVMLSACSESKILATPTNLQIADDYLTWDEVASAKSYVVEVNGVEYETETNSLDVLEITNEPKKYKFSVLALGDYEKTYDSDFSEEIEYEVNEPKNLTVKDTGNGTYEVMAIFAEEPRYEMTGKLIIPEVYSDGKLITAISPNGFRQCKNITSVYIPDSIDTIGEYAFTNATSLTRVRLPEYLEKIAECSFGNCISLKEVQIPKSVTSIEKNAFIQCSALKELHIPENVTEICDDAFKACVSLESVNISEGLKTMGNSVFSYCSSLVSLNLPNTLQSLPNSLIPYCEKLVSLTFAEGKNTTYKSDGNCLIRREDNELILGCNGSVIPEYVTKIGASAFRNCTALDSIVIPEGVEEIDANAFLYCTELQSVAIADSVKTIGYCAFGYCEKLESLNLPSMLESLPKGGIAYECSKLKNLTVSQNNPVYKSENNCILNKSDNVLVMGCAGSVIPDYVKVIGAQAFSGATGLESLVIPEGVTEIGEMAFRNCKDLRIIYIPKSVVKIGRAAFDGCYYASVVVPESVKTIGESAFDHCYIFNAYKTVEAEPEGWAKSNAFGESSWKGKNGKGLYNCTLNYDGAYPYVYSVELGESKNKKFVTPYRQGYTFLGWTTEEGKKEVTYGVQQITFDYKYNLIEASQLSSPFFETVTIENLKISTIPEELKNVKLYAVWQKN